jgi:hypothetical protein
MPIVAGAGFHYTFEGYFPGKTCRCALFRNPVSSFIEHHFHHNKQKRIMFPRCRRLFSSRTTSRNTRYEVRVGAWFSRERVPEASGNPFEEERLRGDTPRLGPGALMGCKVVGDQARCRSIAVREVSHDPFAQRDRAAACRRGAVVFTWLLGGPAEGPPLASLPARLNSYGMTSPAPNR